MKNFIGGGLRTLPGTGGIVFNQPIQPKAPKISLAQKMFGPTSTLRHLPEAIKETGREFKFLPQPLREPAKKAREFIIPESPEQAKQFGLVPAGKNVFLDPLFGVGAMKIVGPTVVKKAAVPIFKGFKALTTKTLEKLKGRIETSKQFISDLTNAPDLKQGERNVLRQVLAEYPEGSKIPTKEFANKVQTELLPLKKKISHSNQDIIETDFVPKWEGSAILPDELRGNIANYSEHVYESPIKTSAGEKHYPGITDNYFAHTRIEDLGSPLAKESLKGLAPQDVARFKAMGKQAGTRRVIELQSDLFQKGRLEAETTATLGQGLPELGKITDTKRLAEVARLEPYRNTWHERIIREEIKDAAKAGKTKLQFPTGETAMKVEGLGEEAGGGMMFAYKGFPIEKRSLKIGREIYSEASDQDWIIIDILGEGKFNAVPKGSIERLTKLGHTRQQAEQLSRETFDISGKVDTSNPIFRFYEKEVQSFLKRIRPDMKRITDPQGVEWFETSLTTKDVKAPIEAFGAGLFPLLEKKEERKKLKLFK